MHPAHPSHSNRLSTLSLSCQVLSLLTMGIMAGFFWTYSINVNLAMLEMDGPIYATVQSAFNRNVRHPTFFAFFFGPAPLALAAMATSWAQRQTTWWRLLGLAALGYALGIVWFTKAINLPLNYATESWSPDALPLDWTATREAWNRANDWRAIASSTIFALAILAFSLRLRIPTTPRSPA